MTAKAKSILLGFEIGTGNRVEIPMRHMVVTGQTQEAGKTTTLEAMISRSGMKAVAFNTKRGETLFREGEWRRIPPYFREQADWQFVASILEASRGEKMRFERAWIIRASKGAESLAGVQQNVQSLMKKATGMSADVYLVLDAYLNAVVPQIESVEWAKRVELTPGLNVMDLTSLNHEMQHLVIRSTIDWVLHHETNTVVVVPEAWKFIPQGRGTPGKLAAESFIRQAAALGNYLWLDSQDIAGVDKIILKSVPVWILGVQREANEIKRTLAQIPAGTKKPKPEDIATLGLGQFVACYGGDTHRVYVQPSWLDEPQAKSIALGRGAVVERRSQPQTKDNHVTEERALALQNRNDALERQVRDLESELAALKGIPATPTSTATTKAYKAPGETLARHGAAAPSDSAKVAPVDDLGLDTIADEVLGRILERDPAAIIRLAQSISEIEVTVRRTTVTMEHSSLRGRLAGMIHDGFFATPVTASAAYDELRGRRGFSTSKPNVYKEMDKFTEMGFVTKESGGYQAVPGMVVRIVEA